MDELKQQIQELNTIIINQNSIIDGLKQDIKNIEQKINKDSFSNLKVFNEQVKFNNMIIVKKDETSISSGASKGRITIKDDTGAIRYIPYFQ